MSSEVWKNWTPCPRLVGTQKCAATLEESLEVPTMLNTELLYDAAIPSLGVSSGEMEAHVHMKTCERVFIAAVNTISKE